MSRRQARIAAMCLLYEREIVGEPGDGTLEEMKDILKTDKIIDDNREYIDKVLETYDKEKDAIDDKLRGFCRDWRLERISKVDISILRLAVIELDTMPEIPEKAVMNEAVELAKKYSSDKAPSFVNGVLGAYAKTLDSPEA